MYVTHYTQLHYSKWPQDGSKASVYCQLVAEPENKQSHFRSVGNMAAPGAGPPTRLVQYVVVRSDLVHKLSWPLGAVITQACHAATAAIHLHYADGDTQRYLAELDSMHKVVLGVSSRIHLNPYNT